MPRYKVMICQFPGGNVTHPDVADWVTETAIKMRLDPRIGEGNVRLWRVNDTPVTMSRNRALMAAERDGIDFVLMVDSDMSPDMPLPGAKPFWDTAWEFALASGEPCVIAAPYCGPPPFEMPYIFRFTNQAGGHPQPDFQITAFSRAECATLTGMVRAAALPTGLMLIDMRAVRKLPHPRFYYEWKGDGPPCETCGCRKGGPQIEKASTEDVAFSRDLYVLGVPMWAAMDCWAGHWKAKLVGKPQLIPDDAIPAAMMARAEEIVRGRIERERVEAEGRRGRVAAGGAPLNVKTCPSPTAYAAAMEHLSQHAPEIVFPAFTSGGGTFLADVIDVDRIGEEESGKVMGAVTRHMTAGGPVAVGDGEAELPPIEKPWERRAGGEKEYAGRQAVGDPG